MALQRKFLHPKTNVLEIPKIRLFGGIAIGFFYAVIWYCFMFLSREAMKLFTIDHFYNNYLTLTSSETYFYNVFFASIASILGFSAMIQFWLERPRRFGDKHYRRRVSIINDQRNLNWTFMLVFSRIATIIGLMSVSMFSVGYDLFSFQNEYYYIFILVIVVLFLNTWNSTRHLFKDKSLKWMFLSASIISIFAFSLAHLNVIDTNAMNQAMLRYNIPYQYNIKVPSSNIHRKIVSKYYATNLHIVLSKDDKTKPLIFFPNHIPANLDSIVPVIETKKLSFSKYMRDQLIIRLIIDKKVKMGIINDVKGKIINAGSLRVGYEITPNNEFKALGRVIPHKLSYYTYEEYLKHKKIFANKNRQYIIITPNVNDEYLIDNKSYSKDNIKPILKDIILTQKEYTLEYFINDEMTFDHYLQFHISYKSVMQNIWNEYAQKEYQKDYRELPIELKKEAQTIYPLSIYDITEDMLEGNSPILGGDIPPPPPPFSY